MFRSSIAIQLREIKDEQAAAYELAYLNNLLLRASLKGMNAMIINLSALLDDVAAIKLDVDKLIASRHDDSAAVAVQAQVDELHARLSEVVKAAEAELNPAPAPAPAPAPVEPAPAPVTEPAPVEPAPAAA